MYLGISIGAGFLALIVGYLLGSRERRVMGSTAMPGLPDAVAKAKEKVYGDTSDTLLSDVIDKRKADNTTHPR